MKALLSVLTLVLTTATFANTTFKCAETSQDALKQGRLQYSVIMKEIEKISGPTHEGEEYYDGKSLLQVSVLSRDPEVGGRFKLDRPTFSAIAKYEDVSYMVESKSKKFSLHIYLDEMNETSMKLSGVRGSVRMNCSAK